MEQNVHLRRNQESESSQKEDLQDQVAKLHLIVKQLKLVIQKQKYMETLNSADLRGMMSTNIRVAETIGGLVCSFLNNLQLQMSVIKEEERSIEQNERELQQQQQLYEEQQHNRDKSEISATRKTNPSFSEWVKSNPR